MGVKSLEDGHFGYRRPPRIFAKLSRRLETIGRLTMTDPRAPKALSREARQWWKRLVAEYGIDDQAGLLLLQTALEAFDRMRGAQAKIAEEGETVVDRFDQVKAHPLLSVERDARGQMLVALKQLNLDLEPLRDGLGRPPGRKNGRFSPIWRAVCRRNEHDEPTAARC